MKPNGPRVFAIVPGRLRMSATRLRAVVRRTLAFAAPQVVGDVCVLVTGDKEIRKLNKRFRAKDAPTDVLAFPLGDGMQSAQPFGDVVISYETARRQARAYGAPLAKEIARLLVHGTLHLCGYDHHEPKAAARMFGATRRLLRELNARA